MSTPFTSPNLSDSGLAAGSLHAYRVRAVDVAGNASAWSAPVAASTANASAPAPVAPVVSAPVSVQTPNLSDTGLAANSQHVYRVRSIDAAGNASAWSAPLVVRTANSSPGTTPTGFNKKRFPWLRPLGGKLTLPDSILHCAMRAPWGILYGGGQVGGADADLVVWNENNAYAPHRGKLDWGVWGFMMIHAVLPTMTTALNLSIAEATSYEGRDEIARVPSGVPLRLSHGIQKDEARSDYYTTVVGTIGWVFEWINCATGAVVTGSYDAGGTGASGGQNSSTQSVGAQDAGALKPIAASATAGSYVLRARVLTERRSWNGLPADYASVSGNAAQPAQFKWTGATGAVYYYDPIWNVGALPFDPNHPLRLAQQTAVLEGKTRKNPAWVMQVVPIGADGLPSPQSGEWSALKVVVGSGQWIGDINCHPNAGFPSLWKLEGELSTQVIVNPLIRAVGALANRGNSLWIGGMLAGRSGPQPFLARYDDPNQAPFSTTRRVPLWSKLCECNLLASKMVNSICWVNGVLHATTPCDSILYDAQHDRLIDSHPGGRCGGALRVGKNRDLWVKTTEGGDFAGSPKFAFSWGTIVAGEPGSERSYRGTPHHVLAALGFKNTHAFYIEDGGLKPVPVASNASASSASASSASNSSASSTPGQPGEIDLRAFRPATRFQGLGRFNGQSRDIVARWDTSRFDLGHIGVCSQYVFAWGHTLDLFPAVARLDTSGADPLFCTMETDLHPRNISTSLSADGKRETLLMVAKEVDEWGLPMPGWGVYELEDPSPKLCFFWNAAARKFSVARSVADASGLDLAKLPPFLRWVPAPGQSGGGQWMPKTEQPIAGVWLQLLPLTSTVVSYSLPVGQTIPYSTTNWDTMCWDGLGMVPNTSCTDAACALGRMPPGTVVSVLQWPGLGQTLDYPVSLANIGGIVAQNGNQDGGGRVLDELYPWLWLAPQGDLNLSRNPGGTLSASDLAALGEFNVRARGWNRHTPLPIAAQTRVRACLLVPPGFNVRKKALKQVG